jgi:hypothetical protein
MSRPFFPAPKRVLFKDPLNEEIRTIKHIFTHWDLVEITKKEEEELENEQNAIAIEEPKSESTPTQSEELLSPTSMRLAEFKFPDPNTSHEITSPIIFSSPLNLSTTSSPIQPTSPTHHSLLPLAHSLPHRPYQRHLKRDSSSSNSPTTPPSEENDSDDSCAHTPVAGRCAKRRRWVWTLGPLEGYTSPVEESGSVDLVEVSVETLGGVDDISLGSEVEMAETSVGTLGAFEDVPPKSKVEMVGVGVGALGRVENVPNLSDKSEIEMVEGDFVMVEKVGYNEHNEGVMS